MDAHAGPATGDPIGSAIQLDSSQIMALALAWTSTVHPMTSEGNESKVREESAMEGKVDTSPENDAGDDCGQQGHAPLELKLELEKEEEEDRGLNPESALSPAPEEALPLPPSAATPKQVSFSDEVASNDCLENAPSRDKSPEDGVPLTGSDDVVRLRADGSSSEPASSPLRAIAPSSSRLAPRKSCLKMKSLDASVSSVKSTATASTCELSTYSSCSKRGVAFDSVLIREYSITLGDHPNCSYGPPVMLDWDYDEYCPVDLDDYEKTREPRRSMRQMCMNYYHRRNILMHFHGYTQGELKQAAKDVSKSKRQREVTRYFLPLRKVEEIVQSTGRKVKRVVKRKSTATTTITKTSVVSKSA